MQRRHLLMAASLAPLGTSLPALAASVGQAAPAFSASDTDGRTHSLADYRGRWVVLEWTNPGCPFVRKHYNGNMQATQKDATARGVVWLAINSTETTHEDYLPPAKLAGWLRERNAAASATLMDESGRIGHAYGARTTPHMYIVNPQGLLVYAGGIDSIPSARVDDIRSAINYVRLGLDEGLAGKPLSMAVTRPYGCSVKYKA